MYRYIRVGSVWAVDSLTFSPSVALALAPGPRVTVGPGRPFDLLSPLAVSHPVPLRHWDS